MASTPLGLNWESSGTQATWSSADATLGTSITNSSNSTSAAYNNYAASASQFVAREFNLVFTYPNSAPTSTVTISLLRQTQGGYQATTDPGLYQWTFTPIQNGTGQNYNFTIPADETGSYKLNFNNGSGFTMSSISLYSMLGQVWIG